MNAKQIGLGVVLLGFAALNAEALYLYGVTDMFRLATANAVVIALFADLVISLTIVAVWMTQDARERGVSVVPYLLLTLLFGSFGPLLYLIRRFGSEPARHAHAAAPARG